MASYILSCPKYLSYSCTLYLRTLTWMGFATVALIHFSMFDIARYVQVGMEMVRWKWNLIASLVHMGLLFFDMLNLKKDRIEDNDRAVSLHLKHRGQWLEVSKFAMLIGMSLLWCTYVPGIVTQYAFYLYLSMCVIVGYVVHYVIKII